MDRSHGALKYKTFKALKELMLSEVDDDIIAEIDQLETYYLLRSDRKQKSNSYFASLQVRIDGVHLQLHTFLKVPSFDAKLFPEVLASYFDAETRSLIFRRLNTDQEAALLEVIREALISH